MLIAAIVFAALWILRELRAAEPLIDLRVIRKPVVLLPNLGSLLAGWSAFNAADRRAAADSGNAVQRE
ncbi:MAG TPA: hypothetical protein VL284_10740 [Thermoanaerobaculia bacterium]|nr:hypothetical protein [Thermoanaerobaculia bacterium]